MTKKNATDSAKWLRYRALQLSRKAGITTEAAFEAVTREVQEAANKKAARADARKKKKANSRQNKLLRNKKVDRKLVEALAKKEKISVNYAYLVLRGQWSLKKAKKAKKQSRKMNKVKGRIKTVGPGSEARSTDWSKVK